MKPKQIGTGTFEVPKIDVLSMQERRQNDNHSPVTFVPIAALTPRNRKNNNTKHIPEKLRLPEKAEKLLDGIMFIEEPVEQTQPKVQIPNNLHSHGPFYFLCNLFDHVKPEKFIFDKEAHSLKIVENRTRPYTKLDIYDASSNVKLFQVNKGWNGTSSAYRILLNDEEIAKCTLIGQFRVGARIAFTYNTSDGIEFTSIGKFFSNEYEIAKNGTVIANIKKKKIKNTYDHNILEISSEEDIMHVVLMVITIEQRLHDIRVRDDPRLGQK
ncbi:UPL2 [Acrasis kona]|uniref:UPL2 n=1 Tax=Acrasis kona TaxID=1008807 RepID=A0AAW2ZCX7_9EUKA